MSFESMKITSLLIFSSVLLIFSGCEKDFDSVVDKSETAYQAISVRTINPLTYLPGDSLVLLSITFRNSNDLQNVFSDIYTPVGDKLNSSPYWLYDNGKAENGDQQAGDNTYSNKFPLSQYYPNGFYTVRYYVIDKNNLTNQVAVQKFKYDNGQSNVAPVISDAVIEPDTMIVTDTTIIQVSIKASDENGASDIESVYFIVFRPDGTSNTIHNELFDSGDVLLHGDLIDGDGIYSLKIQVDQSNMKGTYRFEFQARDRGKKLSNIINYFVLIQ